MLFVPYFEVLRFIFLPKCASLLLLGKESPKVGLDSQESFEKVASFVISLNRKISRVSKCNTTLRYSKRTKN